VKSTSAPNGVSSLRSSGEPAREPLHAARLLRSQARSGLAAVTGTGPVGALEFSPAAPHLAYLSHGAVTVVDLTDPTNKQRGTSRYAGAVP
jgi:hypothetical protein